MDLTMHHVCVTVTDLERSIAFYTALGFLRTTTIEPPDGSRTIVQMVNADGMIELVAHASGATPLQVSRAPVAGLKHIGLHTADVRATLAELEVLGLVEAGVQVNETGTGITMAFVTDPDGTSLEILSVEHE